MWRSATRLCGARNSGGSFFGAQLLSLALSVFLRGARNCGGSFFGVGHEAPRSDTARRFIETAAGSTSPSTVHSSRLTFRSSYGSSVLADVFSYTIDMCTAPALEGAQPQPRTQTRGAPAVKLARCRGCAKTDRRRESIGSKLQAHTPTRIPSARERPPRRRARLCARPRRTTTTQRGRTAGRRPRRTCSGTRPTAGAARGGRRTGSP